MLKPSYLLEILTRIFQKPKSKQKYLIVLREKCSFLDDGLGLVYIVESSRKVKPGMHRSYHCDGLATTLTPEEFAICKKCGYRRTKYIDAVETYSYKKARMVKAESGTRTLREVLGLI